MTRPFVRLFALLALVLPIAFLGACSPAPDEAAVRATVQERLDAAFADPVLEIADFKRLGSGPLADGEDGAERRIVYYNASCTLLRDYAFGDWEALNAAALASLLGAADRGLEGIRPGGNARGDVLRVRGAVSFVRTGDGWRAAPFVAPPVEAPPPPDNTGPPALARSLIESIAALFDDPPGRETEARAIITEELAAAHRLISLRLDRLQRAFVVAGGPAGGEYDLVARAIAAGNEAAGIRSTGVSTQGSVENVQLLLDGSAEVAILQNDVAAMAATGQGLFGGRGPAPSLRALGSLFPEPVHIVVRADGPIRSVADLRGRRVDLGLPDSGSRPTALAVLAAHGIGPEDLGTAGGSGPVRAAAALTAGEIDAFISVITAPARVIQRLSARTRIRLLPLDAAAVAALAAEDRSFVPLVLPAATYAGQAVAVPTVAVTAVLAARTEMPAIEVEAVLRTVFERVDFVAAGSAAGALVSARRARTGLTLPLHPAAEAYFAARLPEKGR